MILNSCITLPVAAYQNINNAYLSILDDAVNQYGEFTKEGYSDSVGVGYVSLIDFDMDGTDELLFCTGEKYPYSEYVNRYEYQYHIYTYKNENAILLNEGSMDAHGGDTNWEITILYNAARYRLITYKYGGLYMSSRYMTVGFLEDGVWKQNHLSEEYVELSDGDYYYDYYIEEEKVDKADYNNRFARLSRHGGGYDIKWTDFSGTYIENVKSELGNATGYIDNQNQPPIENSQYTQWETGEYDSILTIGDYIYYIGKNPNFNNQGTGAGTYYAIWVYNQKTREEKMILEAGSNLQHIGNKLYAVSGLNPSGSWYRNLYCFDLDGSNLKHITSGLKVEVAYGEEPYTIYGDRLYFGYDENQDYCGVKSCTLDGDDIRIEVNPIYAPNREIELHENYAVIDRTVCYYNFSSSEKITVMIDGVEVQFDQPPIIYNDRTLVPLRAIFEALGAEVTWDGETQTVTAVRGKTTIKLTIGAYEFYKNDEKIGLDVPGMIINDRTLVPVRAISESFNCAVSWSGYDKTVFIYQRADNSNILETFEYDPQIEEAINIADNSNGGVSDEELQILFDCVGIANVKDYFDDISVFDVSRTDKSALDFLIRVNDSDYEDKLEAYMSAIEQIYGERHGSPMVGDISWTFGDGEKYIFLTYNVKEHMLYISWSNDYFFNRAYYMQEKNK